MCALTKTSREPRKPGGTGNLELAWTAVILESFVCDVLVVRFLVDFWLEYDSAAAVKQAQCLRPPWARRSPATPWHGLHSTQSRPVRKLRACRRRQRQPRTRHRARRWTRLGRRWPLHSRVLPGYRQTKDLMPRCACGRVNIGWDWAECHDGT